MLITWTTYLSKITPKHLTNKYILCWFLEQLKVSLQIFVEELNRNLAALQVKLSVLNREHKNLKIFFFCKLSLLDWDRNDGEIVKSKYVLPLNVIIGRKESLFCENYEFLFAFFPLAYLNVFRVLNKSRCVVPLFLF